MSVTLIVKIILVIIGGVFTFLGGDVAKKIGKYLVTNHIDKIAFEGVHMAEDYFKKFSGQTKFKHATEYVAKRLKKLHIKGVDAGDIESAVSSAYNKAKHSIKDAVKEEKESED